MLKVLIVVGLVSSTLFILSGYMLSDDKYFYDLAQENHIDSPEKAFQYVNNEIEFVTGNPPEPYTTPRYMLRKKYLWCDEGAMVLATIIHKLGNETRLVDVVKPNGDAGHTYLQVYQNGEWKNYDTVLKRSGLTHEEILKSYPGLKGYARPRPYPRLYNWVIQNNFYLKHLALWLRGAPG